MNLTEIIATTVGIIGSIGGVGTLIYLIHKQSYENN